MSCVPEGAKPLDKQCISNELADLIDTKTTSKIRRGQAIKKVWSYIQEHNLQDPNEPAYIIPDEKMAAVFGKERFVGFTMANYLERHYKREYLTTFDIECESEGRAPLDKQCLSHELRSLINADEGIKMIRGQVVKRVWDYIDEHDLKDPKDTRYIIPDEQMSAVFGKRKFVGFTMTIDLENHYKREHIKVNPTFNGTPSYGKRNFNIKEEVNDEGNNPTTVSLWKDFSDFWNNLFAKDNDGEGKSSESNIATRDSVEEKDASSDIMDLSDGKENIAMDTMLNELNEAYPQLVDVINSKLEHCAEEPINDEEVPDPNEKNDSH